MSTPYAQQTVKQLQQLGKDRRVKGWHTMTKGQLIEALIALDTSATPFEEDPAPIKLNPATNERVDGGTPDDLDIPPALRVDAAEQERRNAARKNQPVGQPAGFSVAPPKPATPTASAAEAPKKATGKRDVGLGRTIRLIKAENPKRPDTAAHQRYALYRDGMAVREFLAAGGTTADIAHDQGKGFIKLENGKH